MGLLVAQQVVPPSVPAPMARIDPLIAERNLRQRVAPVYPPAAAKALVQGTVKLVVEITPEGRVQGMRVVSGPAMLREAAMDAVRQYVYEPFLLNGRAVTVGTEVDVRFAIN